MARTKRPAHLIKRSIALAVTMSPEMNASAMVSVSNPSMVQRIPRIDRHRPSALPPIGPYARRRKTQFLSTQCNPRSINSTHQHISGYALKQEIASRTSWRNLNAPSSLIGHREAKKLLINLVAYEEVYDRCYFPISMCIFFVSLHSVLEPACFISSPVFRKRNPPPLFTFSVFFVI